MRSVLFRFPDLREFEHLVASAQAGGLELPAPWLTVKPPGRAPAPAASDPDAAPIEDGEWLLAVFEVGPHDRATSIAARAAAGPAGVKIVLEQRDCRRLAEFARIEAERPAPAPPPAEEPPPLTERSPSAPPPGASTPPPATSTAPPARATLPSGTGARILVVDDDDSIRDMVAAMLEAVGLVVSTASSAEEALRLFREETFELVVLDWNMPRMTGLELCRALRQKPAYAAMSILFLTANTASSDMVEAFAAGADDYVVKPFRAPELGARIFSLLRRARLASATTT